MDALGWMLFGLVAGVIAIIGLIFWGMSLGMELAVDNTRRNGFFKAYGSRWKAVEQATSTAPPPRQP